LVASYQKVASLLQLAYYQRPKISAMLKSKVSFRNPLPFGRKKHSFFPLLIKKAKAFFISKATERSQPLW